MYVRIELRNAKTGDAVYKHQLTSQIEALDDAAKGRPLTAAQQALMADIRSIIIAIQDKLPQYPR